MTDGKQKSLVPGVPGFVLPSLVLVALAVFARLASQAPLDTSRPSRSASNMSGPPTPDGIDNRFSRLWEDPLSVAWNQPRSADAFGTADVQAKNRRIELSDVGQYFAHIVDPTCGESARFPCFRPRSGSQTCAVAPISDTLIGFDSG